MIVFPTQAEIAAHAGCRHADRCEAAIEDEAETDEPVLARIDPRTVIVCDRCGAGAICIGVG